MHSASYGRVRLNYIWEWSIHYRSLSAMFTPLHSSMNQKLFEKYVCNHSSQYEKYDVDTHPMQLLSETEVSIALLCQLCLTRHRAVRIKKCLKSTSVIKVATMKNTDNFSLCKGSHHKDEWNTKEDTGKPLNNALHVLRYAKRHLSGWSNVE